MNKALFIVFFFYSFLGFSQEDAWVYFIDKPNAQYYFDNPLEMLSQRALDRRTNQNIPLNIDDIPLHLPYIDQVKLTPDLVVKAQSKWLNAIHVRGTQVAIESLRLLPFVDTVFFANRALNSAGKPFQEKLVKKELQVQVDFTYGSAANQIEMLNGNLLHQQDYTGSGKIIAVMDAGFPGVNTIAPFERLRANNQLLGGYDFVNRNADFYTGNNHGTLVLSTMGGFVANQYVGTAPDASYYLFITEDNNDENPLEESLWVEAAETADQLGVDIINTSLGYFTYQNPLYSYTYSDMNGSTSFISRGADKAFSKGIIVVVSAGNSGSSPTNPNIASPADANNVLTVGAVTATKNYASFSSIGPSFDGRIKPDVMAQGQNSVVIDETGTIGSANGTSFSSPIMAGTIASFWQAFPTFTNAQILQLVKQSADRYSSPNPQFGYGIPDFNLAKQNALNRTEFSLTDYQLYPNPVSDFVNVIVPDSMIGSVFTLYTPIGQSILKQVLAQPSLTIALENLNRGVYFYKIDSLTGIKTGKIIKR
jgi:hypothetical protein